MSDTAILDLADPAVKRDLMRRIGALPPAIYEVTIKRRFRGRTLGQNALYHAVIVPAAQDAISEQWGGRITHDQAHDILKDQFLTVEQTHVNEDTGEIRRIRHRRSTTELTTQEFSQYIDQCADWLSGWFGVIVPLPGTELTE